MKPAHVVPAIALTVLVVTGTAAPADEFAREREQFSRAYGALTEGRRSEALKLVAGLENYPLYPYFRYHELNRQLHRATAAEVREFLAAYEGSFLAERLRRGWLKQLKHGQRWQEFIDDYRPQPDIEMQCTHLAARIKAGATEGVAAEARRLWLVGRSQPADCDPAFTWLGAIGAIDDALLWQRIRLALGNNEARLAAYLGRSLMNANLRAAAETWLAVHANPRAGLRDPRIATDDPVSREIVRHGIARLAHVNVEDAESLWRDVAGKFAFTDGDIGGVMRDLAVAAGRQDHPERIRYLDAVPQAYVDDAVEKYRIREGLKTRAWAQLAAWTAHGPVGETNALRWRYWHARALDVTGEGPRADVIFRELATERDYYGFLSADRLGLEYRMNDRPIVADAAETTAITRRPGILRARELFRLKMPNQARREWVHEVNRMTPRELEVAASVVHAWGWHDRAILALGKAESYDDLTIRFPRRHEQLVLEYASRRKLDPAVIFAVIRTESAFTEDARSPAGALGLMQLMPATGRETARRIGLKLSGTAALLDPRNNIALGSAYLKNVIDRFGGSFSLAAAAYNAGPHRVRAWLPSTGCVPADIWIDTIPFTETRRYVRRAAFYAAVYQWVLGHEIERVTNRITAVTPQGMAREC